MDIRYQWQDKAIRYAEKLHIQLDDKNIARWMRIFKQAEQGRKPKNIEKAYGYLIDYPKPLSNEAKMRMFFFIYENGLKKY